MKYFEVTIRSMTCSLIAGALLFVCFPMAIEIITSSRKIFDLGSYDVFFFGLLYVIYAVIQIILSIINGIQADHLGDELDPRGNRILYNFFLAEFSLYLIVYVIMISLIPEAFMIVIVFIFSIPYIICCTASVYIFRYFLRKIPVTTKPLPVGESDSFVNPDCDEHVESASN